MSILRNTAYVKGVVLMFDIFDVLPYGLLSVGCALYLFSEEKGGAMSDKYNIFGARGSEGRIMRTVYFTICEGDILDERNGKASSYHDVLVGKYTPKRATRCINRDDPSKRVRINRTVIMSQLVSMPFWDFWQYAEASDDPKPVAEWILEQRVN